MAIRHRVGEIRRTLAPHRTALAALARPEMRAEETVGQPWPGLVDRLEADCDRFNAELPELRSFVLPGGSAAAAQLHVARTICRRAEREVIHAARTEALGPLVAVYLNRLSDLLFILARVANALSGHGEPLWKPGATRD